MQKQSTLKIASRAAGKCAGRKSGEKKDAVNAARARGSLYKPESRANPRAAVTDRGKEGWLATEAGCVYIPSHGTFSLFFLRFILAFVCVCAMMV